MADPQFRKLEPIRIFELAVDQLRDLILDGAYPPQEKLPTEKELSRQLNVSRSSLREALRFLESEGLIETRRGSGIYVTSDPYKGSLRSEYIHWLSKHKDTLVKLLQVRESIEGLTASLAAVYASKEEIQELDVNLEAQSEIIDELERSGKENIDKMAILDAEFHTLIGNASRNEIANSFISQIFAVYNQNNKAVIYVGHRQQQIEQEHRAIYQAIAERNPEASEKAMRLHIAHVRSELTNTPGQT